MMYRSLAKLLFFPIVLCCLLSNTYAGDALFKSFNYPRFYMGGTIAYGETTWRELTSDDFIVEVSAPKSAVDSGTTWGVFAGYQFDKNFTLEAAYMRYPNALVKFNDFTFYFPLTEFVTRTQVSSLNAKFLIPIANARINAFLNAGIAFTHRSDVLAKVTRVAPTFGVGFMGNASRRVITELGFEYYIGYGKAERRPADDYIPFLFGIYFRLGYRIF